jgi:LmbE family N-acetylglucosaminyl deacetylase
MPVESAIVGGPTLLVAAHPDDETVGAGGILPRVRLAAIVHVTDGAPRDCADAHAAGFSTRKDYAAARRQELLNALEEAAIAPGVGRTLGIADQEASLHMAELTRRIEALVSELRPRALVTHPYEGGHPDHDATTFAVHAACALAASPPAIYEWTSYHAAAPGRPVIETGRFLAGGEQGQAIVLSDEDSRRKGRMIACFSTQLHILRHFSVDVERFRAAPAYDFTAAPHPGGLFYEQFAWGMSGERWRGLVARAMRDLCLQGSL